MEAIVLAGGLGTRLASVVKDRAKPVAEVAGRPFLIHLLAHIERCAEIESAVICVGHKAETVERALGDRFGRLTLHYSRETEPLGTGGAIRQALLTRKSAGISVAMNGDSFFGVSLDRLIAFHRTNHSIVTLALARVADGSRFGTARLTQDKIMSFREKGALGPAWINAGIYVLTVKAKDALRVAPRIFSFEQDLLTPWCAAGHVRGMRSHARFLDIGTPSDYARAGAVLFKRRPKDSPGRTS